MREAFDEINHKKRIVNMQRAGSKVQSQRILANTATKMYFVHLKYWFNRFKATGLKSQHKQKSIKQIMSKAIVRYYRDAFNIWKVASEKKSVVLFNNEEGPEALALFGMK